MQAKALYFRLLAYVQPYWKIFLASIVATVFLGLTEVALPAFVKPLLDGSFVEKDPEWIFAAPFMIVGLFIIRGIASFSSTTLLNVVSSNVVMDLRNQLFGQLMRLPANYYDNNTTGTVLSKVTYNVEQVTGAASDVLIILVKESVTLIGLLLWMLYLDWKLSLIAFTLVPPTIILVQLISKRLRKLSKNLQTTVGEMTHTLEETIGGQRIIRLYGGEQQERKRFGEQTNWVRRYHMKAITSQAFITPIVQLISVIALAIIIYLATSSAETNATSVGTFVSFFAAMAMLLSPLKKLTNINSPLQRGLAASESLFELLDSDMEIDEGRQKIKRISGHIHFKNMSFHYPNAEQNALNHIELDIKAGETIALIGPSGSGKSTLANLIPRFYNHTQGSILIDGIEINDITLNSLRHQIALVSQDVVLFNDTIAANIAYGELGQASEQEIRQAAQSAHALEFIEQLPQGMKTILGENGSTLSGGQRQRLAIARALLKNAPILILDEATSALDSHSEHLIQQALEELQKDRTTIVIAHRLSTIEKADRIIVMDKGNIIEQGKHEDLLKQKGLYASLYQQQFKSSNTTSDS